MTNVIFLTSALSTFFSVTNVIFLTSALSTLFSAERNSFWKIFKNKKNFKVVNIILSAYIMVLEGLFLF